MMISDGFGPASETYARQYHGWRLNLPPKSLLPLDNIHVGHSRTQSSSSLVTDSAAGATAFSCAHKSYNGAIGGKEYANFASHEDISLAKSMQSVP